MTQSELLGDGVHLDQWHWRDDSVAVLSVAIVLRTPFHLGDIHYPDGVEVTPSRSILSAGLSAGRWM